jgi:D-alanyl-D-alanine carboxypeptidase/D-alanyl-D-alanine-endopeptidase (penicillin-binding protein 4)
VGRGDARHWRRRVFLWLPTGLVLVILATAFASFQYDVPERLGWSEDDAGPAAVEPPQGLELPELTAPAAVADPAPEADLRPGRVRAALAPYLSDPDLGRHVAIAVAGTDGVPVFRKGTTATPASTMKLLTTVAALESLGPDRTFATRVVHGSRAKDVVLVGGGDPYLAAKPMKPGDYPVHADLTTLAGRTAAALKGEGRRTVRVRFDDSLFTGPTASPTWPASYADVVAPITALWADQGADPDGYGFAADPSAAAAAIFVDKLRDAGISVTGDVRRTSASGGDEIAAVQSAPVGELVERVLAISDNEGAELLAHHVGRAEGFGASFAGGVKGVTKVLRGLDVPLDKAVIHDGSGLSRQDVLPATTLLASLERAAAEDRPELRSVVTGLPVAGFTGSLAYRFDKGPDAGRGRVRAKTGTLSGVHGLAGVTTDLAGNVLMFVLLADRVRLEDTLDARSTLDQMAAALGACHCGT